MLFDTHTHLNNDSFTDEERAALASEIEASNVGLVMDVGFDEPSSLLAVEHANRYPWCYAVIGMHPHDSKLMDEAMLERFRKIAQTEPKVKAIGEIGLDFHYDLSPRDVQRHWFRRQIQLANELKLPIVVHSREADQEVFDPCFSGSRELAIEYVKAGATIGVDGPLTYKNNKKTVHVVEAIPLEFLMAETDAPYLTPVPYRGKQNKSEYVEFVVRKIAEIKDISYEKAAEATYENGKNFFGI